MAAEPYSRRSPHHRAGPDASAVRLAHWDASRAKPRRGTLGGEITIAESTNSAADFVLSHENIVVLHGFIKKTRTTPPDDLALAKRRMREVKA